MVKANDHPVTIILRNWTKTNKANSPVITEKKEAYHDHKRENHSGKP